MGIETGELVQDACVLNWGILVHEAIFLCVVLLSHFIPLPAHTFIN